MVAGGRHIVGHNMDWYVIDAVNNVLFDLTGPDGTRIMGLAGAPYLLMLGMNSHGVGNVSNSVHSNDNRIGVPNTFVRRATLEARTLEEARDRGLLAARARGTNQFFADAGGRLWDLETSATAHALMDHTGAGFMAHTNHYVSPELRPFEGYAGGESEVRLSTAERLLREGVAAGEDPLELVARVLRTHEPSPAEAICGHPGAGRGAGRAGHDGRQHHLRPGRAPPVRLRGHAVRQRLPGLRDGRRMTVHDLVVAGARVVDGCGNPWYRGDVAVRGDRIAAIGAPGTLRGRRVVDAGDRYVTPGFIDPHTHSDLSILLHPRAETAVRQGVTTHVTGNCGMSAAPLTEKHRADAVQNWAHYGWGLDGVAWDWRTFGQYLAAVRRGGHAINIAPLVGHGALRLAVVGFAERAVTERELARMERLLDAVAARRRARHVERPRVPARLLREHRRAARAVPGGGASPGHLHLARARRA